MHKSVKKHRGAMGIFHGPLCFRVKSHLTVCLQDMSHIPQVAELSCMQKEQCRYKAKPATICTLHAYHLQTGPAPSQGRAHRWDPPLSDTKERA